MTIKLDWTVLLPGQSSKERVLLQGVPENCALLCCCFGGAVESVISILQSCIGQASIRSLRPCTRQSDKWLLIYG